MNVNSTPASQNENVELKIDDIDQQDEKLPHPTNIVYQDNSGKNVSVDEEIRIRLPSSVDEVSSSQSPD